MSSALSILVLGGTGFLGTHQVAVARARGHRVTVFNRGRTSASLPPDVEWVRGDRDGHLEALIGRTWDAVVDNSAYVPRIARRSAELLASNVRQYVFVSSISVYASFSEPNTEASPVGRLIDEAREDVTGDTYGPLKALCEQVVSRAVPGRALIVRPGLIVGPGDPTDRFTYWPDRAARGGPFLVPGREDERIQFIDVRDVASWMIGAIENALVGTFNLVSAPGQFTMGTLIDACVTEAKRAPNPASAPYPVWVSWDFLTRHAIQPWSTLPVWMPSEGATRGFSLTSVTRALDSGLTVRPIATTVRDTLAWHLKRDIASDGPRRAGLLAADEERLLDAWRLESRR